MMQVLCAILLFGCGFFIGRIVQMNKEDKRGNGEKNN
jgi:hypothetical protein